MALEHVSSVIRTTYSNNISGYDITYTTSQNEGENTSSITGVITKNGVRYGYIAANSDGTKTFAFERPVSDEESETICSEMLSDVNAIFTQRNK